ncbi:MAG: hypothetical protein ACRAVC_17360 [Trichormus sp.]
MKWAGGRGQGAGDRGRQGKGDKGREILIVPQCPMPNAPYFLNFEF